ncbi:MAG: hypothetical protein H8E98_03500 [Bacteroidetes bacterium]|nr:hypothetical protein [Bacteroidota bacterium]
MLNLLKDLRFKFQDEEKILKELSGFTIRLYSEKETCHCGEKTHLLKTSSKICYSFQLGEFKLIEGSFYCKKHKYLAENSDRILKYHSELAMEIVDRRCRVTIDLLVKIGLLRYRDHLQLEEIQTFLKCNSAKIMLPISTISMIARRFLKYCKLIHQKCESRIKADINGNGGFIAHFDGSTEKGCGVINFIVKDGLSGHILVSEMIKSENYDDVVQILRRVKFKFGIPLATISDLKNCFKSASEDAFDKKAIHKFCDYHFLRTFKQDFITEHGFIKSRMTKSWKVISDLKKLLKSVEQATDKDKKPVYKEFKDIEKYWEENKDILKTYHLILQWILNFKQASSAKGLPFDLPYLDLYDRLMQSKKFLDNIFIDSAPVTNTYYLPFKFLTYRISHCPHWQPYFKQKKNLLKYSQKWFTKLRGALMLGSIQDKKEYLAPLSKNYHLTEEEAKKIPANIDKFLENIELEISSCKKSEKLKILKRLKNQTKKYKKNLKLPLFEVKIAGELTTIIPYRTNNCLETFFRLVKSLIRRNTGRSAVTNEFASIGDLLPYYVYMKDHKTFKHLFESEERLIQEFSSITKSNWIETKNVIKFGKKLSAENKKPGDIMVSNI